MNIFKKSLWDGKIIMVEIPDLFTEKWLKLVNEIGSGAINQEQVLVAFKQSIEAIKDQLSEDLKIPKDKILIVEKGCDVTILNLE